MERESKSWREHPLLNEHQGTLFWALGAIGVGLCDTKGKETMTSAFRRGMENPKTRPLVAGALGITALHLLDILPRKYDPFYLTIDRKSVNE